MTERCENFRDMDSFIRCFVSLDEEARTRLLCDFSVFLRAMTVIHAELEPDVFQSVEWIFRWVDDGKHEFSGISAEITPKEAQDE